MDAESFAAWLRKVPLKKDNTVYLYNGQRKANQGAQFAVLDISVGHEDLQQCADAVMRLRAEYLFGIHDFKAIDFYTERGARLNFAMWAAERKVKLVWNGKEVPGSGGQSLGVWLAVGRKRAEGVVLTPICERSLLIAAPERCTSNSCRHVLLP